MRVLLENGIRNESDKREEWIDTFGKWFSGELSEISFYPARILMQDLTGVPALVDLAVMRDAMVDKGGDSKAVNPKCQVDLVIDHSVIVDHAKNPDAFSQNVRMEVQRNKERYAFLKWSQGAFSNLRIVPPGKGICHQVNLEYLASVVMDGDSWLYPDTLVGLDSHTTMINGLGVLAWGVGGIEAEAAMLGQPITMNLPEVIGVELKGSLKAGVSATDMVLHLTERLRQHGVVGKFLEFVGSGVKSLTLAERATIANMAPEYGATCAFFPTDEETLNYLRLTAREEAHVDRVEQYLKATDMYWEGDIPTYTEILKVDLSEVESCIAGPKTPEQRIILPKVKESLGELVQTADRENLSDASVVIAAITSCTNTSNPSVLIGAGLLARAAREKGLVVPKWVKPSFAPGSRVVMDYLKKLDLVDDLESLGFYLVGYGCTTCIGNSGPLESDIASAIEEKGLKVSAVLSGNRNFEGRVHPQTQLNYLASPALVVAYAIAGTVAIDFESEPLADGVYLKDIWPSEAEIEKAMQAVSADAYRKEYKTIFEGEEDWSSIEVEASEEYKWDDTSTYIRKPPFFEGEKAQEDIVGANILAVFGDKVTTDHISPAGSIAKESSASDYLQSKGVSLDALHSYGARRGNAEVMVRGTFANIRLVNQMVPEKTGGYTVFDGEIMRIYDASVKSKGKPLVIFAGDSYGMGSSRDWAAKGTRLLGVKAVIANSFERIHRSNLIGMGVLPCLIEEKVDLKGDESVSIVGINEMDKPGCILKLIIETSSGKKEVGIEAAINTQQELSYYQKGGILPYVLSEL
jgi:aconitate hydratase